MPMMQGLRLCAMVGAMSVFGAGAAHAGAEVSHFKSNGANASHNSFNGTTAFDLNVTRNDSASGTTTFFAFFTQTCNADFSVCTGTFGNGFIPNADFTVGGANANLNTNLATNSGFQVFNYVQDATGFNTTPGIGGIVTISWKQIPRQSTSMKGTQTTVFGGFSVKFTGEQSSNSANTTGTLNGVALPTTSSSLIGTSKSSEVIINRN